MYLIWCFLIFINLRHCGAEELVSDENWLQILEGEWMVKFFAPWCPACRALESSWTELAAWSSKHNVHIGSVDVTKEAGLNGRFLVTSLPTIYHVKDGGFRLYSGPRGLEDFMTYIEKQSWKETAPVPDWKSPNSFLMGLVSSVFAVSTHLRNFQEHVNREYGLPDWAMLLVFAVTTIAIGLLLGIVLVLLGEWLWKKEDISSDIRDSASSGRPKVNYPDEVSASSKESFEHGESSSINANPTQKLEGRQRKVVADIS